MTKARPLCTGAESNLGDRVLGAVEKHTLLLCQAKGNTAGTSKNCPNPGGFDEEFYSNGSRVGLLIRLGCVQDLHSSNLISGNLLDKLLWYEEC